MYILRGIPSLKRLRADDIRDTESSRDKCCRGYFARVSLEIPCDPGEDYP